MNKLVICKYVNATNVICDTTKLIRSQFAIKQFTQTSTELRQILDVAAKQLNIANLNDWYKLPTKDYSKLLEASSHHSFEKDFHASPFRLLSSAYPEHDWMPWKFEKCPPGFWDDVSNQKAFLNYASKQLKISDMSDWYNVTNKDLEKLGGSLLLNKTSLCELLSTIYPDYEWLPWKFERCPRGFWADINNARKYMSWAATQLGVKEMSDWYQVTYSDFRNIGGRYLLESRPSYADLLSEVYPEYEWLPWKFDKYPANYWNDNKNRRSFMSRVAKQLGVKEMSDWYKVSTTDLKKVGGAYLLNITPSYMELLTEVYPEYDWLPWKFEHCPKKYWNDIKNVRKFMDWVAKQLNVKEMSDWYNVSHGEVSRLGGAYLLQIKTSYIDLLSEVYPEYNWLPWKFSAFSSKSLLTNPNRRQQHVDWMANKLNVKEMSDWYKIEAEQIIDLGGGILLLEYQSLPKLLSTVYSEYKWDESKFEQQQSDIWSDNKLANYFVEWLKNQGDKDISVICQYVKQMGVGGTQDVLPKALQQTFPNKWIKISSPNSKKSQYRMKECIEKVLGDRSNTLIMEEYKHPDVVNLELDYYLPEYKIAFEYQGLQHYRTVGFHNRKESIDTTRKRDRNKIDSCKELGITLIEVPYWWDRKINSLAATIYNSRPDLFKEKPQGNPIPIAPLQKEQNDIHKTNVSKQVLMTATVWDNETMNPNGWFMTEKYDGMRFYWDGTQCYSRQGNKLNIPVSISSQLPPVALDGELWTQYGLHQEAVQLALTSKEEKWNKAIFWIFDAPKLDKPLEDRIEFLQQLQLPSFAKVVEFVKCEGKEHLKQFNDAIIAKGGEGVMLREPESMYKRGRSTSLRKYKPYLDTEVKVLKNQYPLGFICEQLNGKVLFVRSENSEESKSIKEGAVITIKHSGTNVHGTLQYPQFYRERLDVSWNDLLNKVV